jgi:hypothetical protein
VFGPLPIQGDSDMIKKLLLASVLALGAAQAQAAVVDFEELDAWDGGTTGFYGTPLISGGLIFTNNGDGGLGDDDQFVIAGPDSPIASVNGTNVLIPNYFGSTTTVSAVGGALFTLESLQLADIFDFADDPIQVTFNFSDGSSDIVILDFFPGMQTVNFDVSGIVSFDFTASGSLFGEDTVQLDNITYTLDDVNGAVPEPASWAMMIVGFGAVGGAMRSRRRSETLVAA